MFFSPKFLFSPLFLTFPFFNDFRNVNRYKKRMGDTYIIQYILLKFSLTRFHVMWSMRGPSLCRISSNGIERRISSFPKIVTRSDAGVGVTWAERTNSNSTPVIVVYFLLLSISHFNNLVQ